MEDTEVSTRFGGFGRGVLSSSKQAEISPGKVGMSSGFGKPSGDFGSSNGFGSNDDQSKSGGFGSRGGFGGGGGGRGGFGSSGDNTGGDRPQRGGFGGGGGRGGFGSSGDNTGGDMPSQSGGFGGRGGFGGGGPSGESNGFGGGKRGGFGGRGGFSSRGDNDGDDSEQGGFGSGGFGSSGDSERPKRGGFGGGGGRGGFGGSRGGFGGGGGTDGERPPRGGGFGSSNGEKKSGDGCFKCGESGHFSRECPNGGGSNGEKKSGDGCFKCGESGHFSRECPNAGSSNREKKSGDGCFKCGESGHFSRECPNAGGGGRKDGNSGGDGITLDKDRPPPYVPPAPSEDEEEIFKSMTKGINFDNFDKIPAEVTGKDPPAAINSFEEAGLYDAFLQNVRKSKYEKPTPVQKHAIPIIMAGRDLMACAQTGSGKTAAFLLPTLTGMMKNGLTGSSFSAVQEPQALVVAPTRELAVQICRDAYKFAHGTMLKAVVLYGGTSIGHQLRQVEKGCHLLVGTPGRLIDMFTKGKVSLEKIKYLILDEADRMLDMGFGPEIRKIIETFGMPGKDQRQTLMFSATFPEEIQKLAAEYLNDYLFLSIGMVGGASSDVSQHIFEVDRMAKREKLVEILSEEGTSKTLVFVEQKRNADFLAAYLSQTGFPTTSIHGDRLQQEREEALADFKLGKAYILVATSVAARGLDIPAVKHVINYDLPSAIDEYVHRIGRTGRCGNLGKATSFYDPSSDSGMAKALVKILKQACQVIPDWLDNYAQGAISTAGYVPMNSKFGGKDIRKNVPRTRTEVETSSFGGGFGGGFNTGIGGGGSSAFDAGDEESWD